MSFCNREELNALSDEVKEKMFYLADRRNQCARMAHMGFYKQNLFLAFKVRHSGRLIV